MPDLDTTSTADVDAIVVGASVAGSATATLLARHGLRVALIERSSRATHHTQLCGHEMLPLGIPVLDRLGVLEELRDLSGGQHAAHIWTPWGWIRPQDGDGRDTRESLNVRRSVMDPILRRVAAATPGVELLMGTTVRRVLRSSDGRPSGVELTDGHTTSSLTARVVVGADGQNSTVAEQTSTPISYAPQKRFGYVGYFRDVAGMPTDQGPTARFWFLDPDIAYSFPTDGGLTVLAVAPHKTPKRLQAFRADTDTQVRRVFASLPDAPDVSDAILVGRYTGLVSARSSRRTPGSRGLAFVGDAAQVTDFVWGTGCSFALVSAEWLADTVGPVLAAQGSDRAIDTALIAYSRHHTRRLKPHYLLTSSYSTGRPISVVERTLLRGAARDQVVAHAVREMTGGTKSPAQAITPQVVGRAMLAGLGQR